MKASALCCSFKGKSRAGVQKNIPIEANGTKAIPICPQHKRYFRQTE